MSDLIRTRNQGCFRPTADPWGVAYDPCPDPLAEVDGRPSFKYTAPKLTADQWRSIMSLFDYLAEHDNPTTRGTSEVQVVLARPVDGTPDRFRIFVPRQEVDRTEVDAEMDCLLELETGEAYPGLPDGLADAGTVHSHNYMGAFWSSTDNQDQIKRWGLHLVVGDLGKQEYAIKARVTRPNQVVDLPWQEVADACSIPRERHFHPDVLKVITLKRPPVMWTPSMSRLCQAFKCYEDREQGSAYCGKHKAPPVLLCRELTCMVEAAGESKYCKEHSEALAEALLSDGVEVLKERSEEELLMNIQSLIDEHVEDYGPLGEGFWIALKGVPSD
jgi:proteasome lid subunit RPN8/RPN11